MTANIESASQDQRPWVWISAPGPFTIKVGEEISLNISIINYGKTPAKARMLTGLSIDWEIDSKSIKAMQQITLPAFDVILAPGEVTKPIYTTAIRKGKPLDQEEYNRIISGGLFIVAAGRIGYTDLRGNAYESAFCVYRISATAVANCPAPELNYMK